MSFVIFRKVIYIFTSFLRLFFIVTPEVYQLLMETCRV